MRPSTFGNWLVIRSFVVDGSTEPGVEAVKEHLKIYHLSEAENPPEMKFVKASGVPATFVPSGDDTFWSLLNEAIDVYFGPTAPEGKESNWVPTIPGKSWFMILRLYGPLEPWFDKTWRPGEIELVK